MLWFTGLPSWVVISKATLLAVVMTKNCDGKQFFFSQFDWHWCRAEGQGDCRVQIRCGSQAGPAHYFSFDTTQREVSLTDALISWATGCAPIRICAHVRWKGWEVVSVIGLWRTIGERERTSSNCSGGALRPIGSGWWFVLVQLVGDNKAALQPSFFWELRSSFTC